MDKWISVNDELPPITGVCDGGTDRVLVYLKRDYAPCVVIASGDYSEDGFSWYFYYHMEQREQPKVTHWMPLPEAPEREN
jgi:hypothetical protein